MNSQNNVKKLCYVFIFLLTFNLITTKALAADIGTSAKAHIIIDGKGDIISGKNDEMKLPPASTTKILTAIMGIEEPTKHDYVKISEKAAKVEESTIYLNEGDMITMEDLIKGALIKSGNDATVAIGEYICGDIDLFVFFMNKKAKLLGAFNTNFENPNGLPAEKHYSTARDLAIIARYSMHNDEFKKIVSSKTDTINKYNSQKNLVENIYLKNTNKLLNTYPGTNGIKTGTTRAAGQCLIASFNRNDETIISVVLNSRDRFYDTKILFDNSYKNDSINSNLNIFNIN